MVRHEDLHKVNRNKKDEFYTTYDVIQAELNYYTDTFKVSVNTNFFCLTNEKTDIGLIEVCLNSYVIGFQH